MASRREDVNEALIPGLQDDLALRCLARISHGFHGVLKCVCKRWRHVMSSEDYVSYKSRRGWCGDWLFVLAQGAENQWADRRHALPRIPSWNRESHFGFSCVGLCNRFLVIGGAYYALFLPIVVNQVFSFDPFRQQWSEVASMSTPRSDFACSVICGKVYVGGGWNSSFTGGLSSAEVYDPVKDRWDNLPTMPNPRAGCFGVSYDCKFYILSDKLNISDRREIEVFNPCDRSWCTIQDMWQPPKKLQVAILVINGRLYTVIEGENSVQIRNTETGDWYHVGSVPAAALPDHPRLLEFYGYSACGLRKELYIVGGKTIKLEEKGDGRFDIVKLRTMRVCDPSITPLRWRETRPIFGPAGGSILGCGSLEECLQ
uniref:F-box/kelch-repeat protein n=1 Tax=Kalanchoe fedtschenkoi TaxID=63787 RepID=A0A7N0UI02_KALFE